MCLVTVHQHGGQVVTGGGGIVVMANTGLLRLRRAFLVSSLRGDDDDFPGGCTAAVGTQTVSKVPQPYLNGYQLYGSCV